jgi:hypothetical protein
MQISWGSPRGDPHELSLVPDAVNWQDTDGNGAISFDELRDGIKKIPGAADVDLSRSEFDGMTEQGSLLDANGSFALSLPPSEKA